MGYVPQQNTKYNICQGSHMPPVISFVSICIEYFISDNTQETLQSQDKGSQGSEKVYAKFTRSWKSGAWWSLLLHPWAVADLPWYVPGELRRMRAPLWGSTVYPSSDLCMLTYRAAAASLDDRRPEAVHLIVWRVSSSRIDHHSGMMESLRSYSWVSHVERASTSSI